MNGRTVVAIVAFVIVISASTVVAVGLLSGDSNFYNSNAKEEYNISYVLDGGTNSKDNPEKYEKGVGANLYAAEKEGYVFIGWFLDEDLTEGVTKISRDMTGDITLYAYWEISQIGSCFTYDISGNTVRYTGPFRTDTPISGSVMYTFLTYRYGKGYYINYDQTLTTGTGKFANTTVDSDQYWSEDNDSVWTKGDNAVIDTINGSKECCTWTSTSKASTEKQYVGLDDDITYLMEYRSTDGKNTTTITYTLTETHTTVIADEFDVDVYCDKGITVTGSGTSDAYSTVTLTASGESFSGWYSASGSLLSSKQNYTIDILLSNIVIYARNTNDADLSFDSTTVTVTPDVELTDVTWKLDDNGTEITRNGNTLNYTFSHAGSYVLLYSGTDSQGKTYHGLYDVFTDGLVTKNYAWRYNNINYSATLNIRYSDFMEYRNDDISRSQGTTTHDVSFVTYEDPYIIELVGQIQAQCIGESDEYIANVILAFTQYIEYEYDSDSMGVDEYWKYPLETLYDENGDCEDTSFLFCALAKAGGYNCALILYSGHMAAGINIDGISGSGYYVYSSVRYYYCETTATGWSVGDTPSSELVLKKVMPVS